MSALHRTMVVSGGSRGIGAAIVHRFAEEGFDVATAGRDKKSLEELSRAHAQKYRQRLDVHSADLAKPEAVKAWGKHLLALPMVPDVLIHNVGIYEGGPLMEEAEGAIERSMATNVYSAYYLSRMLLPAMRTRGSGHIFFIGSIAGIRAYSCSVSYTASKFALHGLAATLRNELKGDAIRVTHVAPGATWTDMWEGSQIDPHRMMPAEEIATAIWDAYALSSRSVVEEIVLQPQEGNL